MASTTFPKIPVKNWWLLRDALNRKMPSQITRNYLATVLDISERTASNILPELRQLGLTDEGDTPTDLANRWRFDEDYGAVSEAIRKKVYPPDLEDAIPDPSQDLDSVARWFQRHGQVGENAAKNIARLYSVISEADPLKKPEGLEAGKTPSGSSRRAKPKKSETTVKTEVGQVQQPQANTGLESSATKARQEKGISLHIDLQVHISPESTPEQIDQIFKSIRKHLYAE